MVDSNNSLNGIPVAAPAEPRRMLNEKMVLEIVPIGHTTLWRLEKAGRFPKSTYISPNRRIWFADEIAAWQKQVDGQGRRAANLKS
jgi:prophage regulatory protein